jgi:phosphoglycerol transferase MdoB-like AlkP superfamily enzyme
LNKLDVSGFLSALLSRRDWVYLLSLLVPLIVYDLVLKAAIVASVPGLALTFDLMRSDVFFNLGYTLLWIGLFAAARRRLPRHVVVVLFHATTILVVLVNTCAYQYFQQTGTALDYNIIALWLPDLKEVLSVLSGSVPFSAWVLLLAALFYAAFGPWFLTRAISWWRGWNRRSLDGTPNISFLGSLGLWLLAFYFGSLSLLIGASPTDYSSGASVAVVRDPVVNVFLTGVKEASTTAVDNSDATGVEHPAAHASLVQTPQTQKRNVVLIHLESTRVGAITPYNANLKTTPFLDQLAKNSLLAEQYYTIVPHTSKASVSVNCGIEPHLVQPTTEANADGVPVPCLAGLLKDQGYSTALFQSSTQNFEDFGGLVKNFGYEDYYPLESMDPAGFQKTNYFGYEDDIMLKPSEAWLQEHKDKPFMAEYLLGTGHHDYECRGTSHGDENFSDNDLVNYYLNCMRLQDIFVKNLFDQYKKLGLYDNTIFVLYGDHGEGFGEHGRFVHDDTIYQEGLQVPLIIHAPGLLDGGERVQGLSNHIDILPTVLDLLGYEVKDGKYPGYSLLHPLPEDRTLRFSCFHEDQCLASIKGTEKYIYHYGNQPEELFDLSKDSFEKDNLADERSKEEMDKRREDLLKWRSSVNATYALTGG